MVKEEVLKNFKTEFGFDLELPLMENMGPTKYGATSRRFPSSVLVGGPLHTLPKEGFEAPCCFVMVKKYRATYDFVYFSHQQERMVFIRVGKQGKQHSTEQEIQESSDELKKILDWYIEFERTVLKTVNYFQLYFRGDLGGFDGRFFANRNGKEVRVDDYFGGIALESFSSHVFSELKD